MKINNKNIYLYSHGIQIYGGQQASVWRSATEISDINCRGEHRFHRREALLHVDGLLSITKSRQEPGLKNAVRLQPHFASIVLMQSDPYSDDCQARTTARKGQLPDRPSQDFRRKLLLKVWPDCVTG